jgi:sec-independent protein translocase protein TatB
MFGLGFSEIVVLAVLALILLGPDQLPSVARKVGKFVNELKRTTDGIKEEFRDAGLDPRSLLNDLQHEQPPKVTPEMLHARLANAEAQKAKVVPPAPPVSEKDTGGHHDNTQNVADDSESSGKNDSGKT